MCVIYLETAVNIAYSCHLLTDSTVHSYVITGQSEEEVKRRLVGARTEIHAAILAGEVRGWWGHAHIYTQLYLLGR